MTQQCSCAVAAVWRSFEAQIINNAVEGRLRRESENISAQRYLRDVNKWREFLKDSTMPDSCSVDLVELLTRLMRDASTTQWECSCSSNVYAHPCQL